MAHILLCPECGKDDVLRTRCFTACEHLADACGISPFRCQQCHHRFLSWRFGRRYPTSLVDRRKHHRIPVRLALSFSGGRVHGQGTVLDISMGGCIIKSDTHVQIDDIFYLQIYVAAQDPPIEVAAMVRSIGYKGIGFKFLRAARENKRLFDFLHSRGA
jgi:hypothetical protein